MKKATKICKVCGAEYPYCKVWGCSDAFRWQDVGCCEEHGMEYFATVMAGRNGGSSDIVDQDLPVNANSIESSEEHAAVDVPDGTVSSAQAAKKSKKKQTEAEITVE